MPCSFNVIEVNNPNGGRFLTGYVVLYVVIFLHRYVFYQIVSWSYFRCWKWHLNFCLRVWQPFLQSTTLCGSWLLSSYHWVNLSKGALSLSYKTMKSRRPIHFFFFQPEIFMCTALASVLCKIGFANSSTRLDVTKCDFFFPAKSSASNSRSCKHQFYILSIFCSAHFRIVFI